MSNKQLIIRAIKEMDILKLEQLLDDERSYMSVTKQLFLKNLQQQFDSLKEDKIYEFKEVLVGTCQTCNKGCDAITFITEDNCVLNLFFEENNGEVTDIYLCSNLKNDKKITPRYSMYFDFYDDEKVDFKPSVEFLIKKQKIEDALSDFEKFSGKTVLLENIQYWGTKNRELLESFSIMPFMNDYKQFEAFQEFSSDIKQLLALIEKYQIAKQAMSEFKAIESERELVYWLFTYEWNHLTINRFNRLEDCEKSSLIAYQNAPSIVIDCSSYYESLEFSHLYNKHLNELIYKYDPTPEHFKIAKNGITYSLESHLRAHGMYLDIIPDRS